MAKVNYVREHIQFMEFAAEEALTLGERVLWYALMHLFNRRARGSEWPDDYVRVNNRRLMLYCGMKYDTMARARQGLRQRGLIDYIEGERNRQIPAYRVHYFGEGGEPVARALDVPGEAVCFGGGGDPVVRALEESGEAACFGGEGDGPMSRTLEEPGKTACFGGGDGSTVRALEEPEEVLCDDWLWDFLDDADEQVDADDVNGLNGPDALNVPAENGARQEEFTTYPPRCPQISDNMGYNMGYNAGGNMGYNMGECPADIYINKTYTGNGKRYPNRVPEDEEETGNSPVDRARAREAVGPTGTRGDMDADAGGMEGQWERGVGAALRRPPCAKRVEGPDGKRPRLYSVGTASMDADAGSGMEGRREHGVGAALRRPPCARRVEGPGGKQPRLYSVGTASMDADAGSGMEREWERGVGAALRRPPCAKRVEGPGGKQPCLYSPVTSSDLAAGETRAIGRSPLRDGGRRAAGTDARAIGRSPLRDGGRRVAGMGARAIGRSPVRRPGGLRNGAPTRGLPTAECHYTECPETARVAPVRAKAMGVDAAAVALAESWMRAYGRPIAPAVLECLLSEGGRRLGRNSPLLGEAVRMAALRCADSPVDYIRALYRDWQARKITTEDDLEAYLDGMKVS